MNPDGGDWETVARFWMGKYLENVLHNAQVIGQLARPYLIESMVQQQRQQQEGHEG